MTDTTEAPELAPDVEQAPTRTAMAMIEGVAHVMADRIVTSAEIEDMVQAQSPDFAVPRGDLANVTGCLTRRFAEDDEYSSTFAIAAAKKVMEDTGTSPDEIDLVIFASSSHDIGEPATVHIVQEQIGTRASAFDLKNACNSFINAMQVAENMIAGGAATKVLICTGEVPTRAIRWSVPDQETWRRSFAGYTVGDGGAAMIMGKPRDGRGIWHRNFQAESEHWRIMTVMGGGTRHPRDLEYSYFSSDGSSLRKVFQNFAPRVMAEAFIGSGTTFEDFDLILVHQVSKTQIESISQDYDVDMNKFVMSLPRYGNISSCSLPLQLDEAIQDGRVGPGSKVMMVGLGAGISVNVMMLTL
ncbi:MAG: ketoacyl-ACP synthase III [Thermoleophilia bacterium]|nr:ketoacyl-ACP synthase III [Thermoleophilia bacterium]